MLQLTHRSPEFFKKVGFKTKKQALKALRIEELRMHKKKNQLFDSYESFRDYSINIMIPEINKIA